MNYLIIRPISDNPADVEPYLDRLKIITGLNSLSLKQKFLGNALNLLTHHAERKVLDDISKKLSDEGISSIVVSKEELRRPHKSLRAASLDISSRRIELLSKDNETLLKIDKETRCLVVISCKGFKKINTKKVARHVMRFTEAISPDELLKEIFMNQPVMDIYSNKSPQPIRIDSARFNYTTLGEKNRNSAALNFKVILELISKHAGQVILETGFGENSLPFLNSLNNPDKEKAFRDFAVYSFMVNLACERGIFQAEGGTGTGGLIPVPILNDLTSIFWAGPGGTNTAKKKGARKKSPSSEAGNIAEEKDRLPNPPEEFTRSRSTRRSVRLLGRTVPGYGRFIRGLGPAVIFHPLSLLIIAPVALVYVTGSTGALLISLMGIGIMLFSHSFVLIKRKRLIENCPRSKMRSMPMGEVEVGGKAAQKYYLKSPYTYTNCVYYSYKIYHLEHTNNGNKWVLKEWNDSGRIPFYLEDSTGSALILPGDAILHAGVKETISGDMLNSVFGGSAGTRNRRIVETTIPTGQFLYVFGHAHRLRISAKDKSKEMTERLLDLKHDKTRLKKYDTDRDGKISSEEWDAAREDIADKILDERLTNNDRRDEVAIGAHPSGGLFIISDKKESNIVKSMAWKIPLYLAAGSGAMLTGLFFILKITRNNDILSILESIF